MSPKYLPKKLATALFVVGVALIIGGCATTDQESAPKIQSNPEIDQAVLDLEEARQIGAVWVIRDPAFDNRLVSLDEMLQRASSLHSRRQAVAASTLARRVSRFARLGIQQATTEASASPYYPQ